MIKFQTPSMNLNLIRTFVIVGQSKDLADATSKLNIDRTNVSRHIVALEKLYGTKLLNNDSKTFELTEAGKKLFAGYEKAYNMMFITEKNFLQEKSLNSGKLTIGISIDASIDFVSEKITAFKKQYPNVVIKIINLPTKELYDKLSQFYMDFIIDVPVSNLQKIKNIKIENIATEEFCIIYSKKLGSLEIKSIKDLDNLPLILPITAKKERIDFEKMLEAEKINKNVSLEVDHYDFAVEYAKAGLGLALVPKRCIKKEDDFIVFDINLTKTISIAFIKENVCPSAKKLLEGFGVEN